MVWKVYLQTLHCPAPKWRAGLADGVLVPEDARILNGLRLRHSLQPLHRDEVFAFLRVVRPLSMAVGRPAHVTRLGCGKRCSPIRIVV